jgi:hypothetical protein
MVPSRFLNDRRWPFPFLVLVATFCGVVLGLVVSVVIGAVHGRTARPATATDTSMAEPIETIRDRNAGSREVPFPRVQYEHNTSLPEVPDRITPEKRQTLFESELKRHSEEPLNSGWANASKVSMEKVLGGIAAAQGFALIEVDCRTTTCVGTFEWSSYNDATERNGGLLHALFKPNCYREIVLPEPSDKRAAYRGQLLVDCGKGGEFPVPD